MQLLPEISGRNDGRDNLSFPFLDGEDHDTIRFVKELLLSFKKEIDSYIVRLESGHCNGVDFGDSVGKFTGDEKALGIKWWALKIWAGRRLGFMGWVCVIIPKGMVETHRRNETISLFPIRLSHP